MSARMAPTSLFPACSVSNDETERAGGTRGENDKRHPTLSKKARRQPRTALSWLPGVSETVQSTPPRINSPQHLVDDDVGLLRVSARRAMQPPRGLEAAPFQRFELIPVRLRAVSHQQLRRRGGNE